MAHAPSRPPHIELARVGGRTVRVAIWHAHHDHGRGQRPLLFFNGIGANIELMSPLAEWIQDRDIITFDMPGVGQSPAPVTPYRPWTMARFTTKLLDRYGYKTVDVMGVSWGGGMAQQIAFQYPKRVGKVILAATSAGAVMVPGHISVLSKMAHPKRYMDPNYMRTNFQFLYGGEADGADLHAKRVTAPSRRGYLYQLAAMAGWTSAHWLPFLRQKVLIMMGDRDKIVPVVNGRILETLIPRGRLHVVPGGGHLFLISRARECIPAIKEFLAEPDESAARAPSAAAAVV